MFQILGERGAKAACQQNLKSRCWDFPGDPVGKNPPGNAGHVGSIPGLRSHMSQGN